jgi:hypothetical protein
MQRVERQMELRVEKANPIGDRRAAFPLLRCPKNPMATFKISHPLKVSQAEAA